MDLDTYRRESRETWAQVAPGWEERREWFMGITGLVTDAGFGEPEREEIAFEFRYLDFDDLWNALLRMSPSGRTIDELSAEEQRATVEAVRKNLAPYPNEDGSYSSPAATWGVLAS